MFIIAYNLDKIKSYKLFIGWRDYDDEKEIRYLFYNIKFNLLIM